MNLLKSRYTRLLRTTALRLAFRYVLAYTLVLGIALAALSWSTSRYVDVHAKAKLRQEMLSLTQRFEHGGAGAVLETVGQRLEGALGKDRLYLMVSSEDEKLAGNLAGWPSETSISTDGQVRGVWIEEEVLPRELYEDDAYLPVIATELPDGSRLLLARKIQQAEELHEVTEYLTDALAVAVLLALALGVTLGHSILGRINTISRTAGEIMAGDLSQRMPVSNRNDEFDALAARLNIMLDRIQQLIRGVREVTDHVAHDLRSPLTRLRNRLEITLLESRSEQEYREAIASGIADTESLIKTFNALLEIAQAEAGQRRSQWESVDLGTLTNDLTELYEPVAEERGQTLELRNSECAEITGSRNLLAQAIGNLLENAVKYTPKGGLISLQVRHSANTVDVVVSDTGPGIPESERGHVLERFVRLETSRHTPGNGLGLSLVYAVSKLHKAELLLGDAKPGLIITIRFPRP